MSKKNSDIIHSSPNQLVNAFRKGLMSGAGYDTDNLKKKPLIAIANSHTEMTAGHNHLGRLADKVKEGILIEGGEYAEFNVPAPCDGIAMAHDGMRYVLAQRDLIADIVETHVRSQAFDAVVFIAGCDKINPGMMMAMGRLDLPSIYLAGGPGQMNIRNVPRFSSSIDHNDFHNDPELLLETFNCSTCGACEIMGTANTFQCLAEAMGICLPGSSNIPGWHSDKLKAARHTGQRVVQMYREGLNARQLLTQASLENAARMLMAIGGSTNGTLHLPAIAHSAGVELTLEHFKQASEQIPTLLAISPNGPWGVQDLWAAGGMPAVLKVMQADLDTSTKTVTGGTLQEVIDGARVLNSKVIPPRETPHRPTGGISVLHGNLAEGGAVVKQAGVIESMLKCTGPAVCFDSEDEALAAVQQGQVKEGDIMVLRYQGPKGGPGMPEMLGVTVALKAAGLSKTALVTDGRFSGATCGPCIGHICPEASDGGLIGVVKDGDLIEIDILGGKLNVELSDEEIARRREGWQPLVKEVGYGFMDRYRRHVRPASEGAILD
ncbi:dihydroxy-acid dehydratase [Aestuariirhabdus litorea]|uniref:Dihydroxy-acid dehydratase n=1 Tax=Aestuariirhabdus litorea TaxID=2528527 RepID=A0A3P3VR22_9GAMM|nr:dihydroxy-acid dehydratase [Aestuariirhabdus litorea]RRJ83273.1 dihydroxy-acid dehydratase [Aestuariirhabdus litorea]RWW93432.1 dihydroxy-acid dehydratase [Endozoicomonadaceae bacterium GTF-13]